MSLLNQLLSPQYEIFLAGTLFVMVFSVLLIVKSFLSHQLRRLISSRQLSLLRYPQQLIQTTGLPFLFGVALLMSLSQYELPPAQKKLLHYAWVVVLIFQITLWANRLVSMALNRSFEQHRVSNPAGTTHLMVIGLIARLVLWFIALLVLLDNLGFNVTTLMASLGIGGIAVALAVQNILGDVLSSVSIALDKPFVIGDFIVVDSYMGTVEYVGLKTTRIRSLGGEQIIISNNELLKNRIRNYQRLQERRVQFEFGVAYDTPPDRLEQIPGMVKEIITASGAEIRFDRAHFRSYSESALQFEVVYFVLTPDYNKYMDIQQEINLGLLKGLRERGIAFGHPMRALYLTGNAAHALKLVENPLPPRMYSASTR